jgi:presenilin-like A22 family membrane protease
MVENTSGRWNWMSIIAAVLLAAYSSFALYGLLSPSTDPQRGMADGFILFVVAILATLGALLWLAVRRGKKWLVRIIFAVTVLPALSPIARVIYVMTRSA